MWRSNSHSSTHCRRAATNASRNRTIPKDSRWSLLFCFYVKLENSWTSGKVHMSIRLILWILHQTVNVDEERARRERARAREKERTTEREAERQGIQRRVITIRPHFFLYSSSLDNDWESLHSLGSLIFVVSLSWTHHRCWITRRSTSPRPRRFERWRNTTWRIPSTPGTSAASYSCWWWFWCFSTRISIGKIPSNFSGFNS